MTAENNQEGERPTSNSERPHFAHGVRRAKTVYGAFRPPSTKVHPGIPVSEDNSSIETNWITSHINKRVCKKFVEKQESDKNGKVIQKEDPLCICNLKRSEHTEEALSPDAEPRNKNWSPSTHTTTKPTDAFGEVEFLGFGQKISKYVRVDAETEMKTMIELLMGQWQLEKPNLLISVTGGAKNFHMKPRLKEVFRRGLMKAAQSTGAWIITGGMHAGVMKHVGEAVRDYSFAATSKNKVTCIGISPWGCVANVESVINKNGCWPAPYKLEAKPRRKESPIDLNHSHFILVDNGTKHTFATEIKFRTALESAISVMKTNTGDDAVSIPIVCVVLEGGPGTLETVKSAMQNNTPAVIVEGSGRAADILAYAYSKTKEEEIEVVDQLGRKVKKTITLIDPSLEVELTKKLETEFGEKNLSRHIGWLKECIKMRELMTVFQLDSKAQANSDIDYAILHALLKANQSNEGDQLKLALAWNRIDVAKSDIFHDDKKWEHKDLTDVMFTALLQNRTNFVQLFIENGLNIKEFVSIKTLLKLYNSIPPNSVVWSRLEKERTSDKTLKDNEKKYFNLSHVGEAIQELMGDFYYPLYLREPMYSTVNAADYLEEKYSQEGRGVDNAMMVQSYGGAPPGDLQKSRYAFEEPARELFIWCVLMARDDLAMTFWEEGKDTIAAALTASMLLKELSSKCTEDFELQAEMMQQSTKWGERALGVLNACFAADEERAGKLLVRELELFGNTTVIALAVNAKDQTFISHSCCQSMLNDIWMGKMSVDNHWWRLMVSIICPPLLWLLIRFKEPPSSVESQGAPRIENTHRHENGTTPPSAVNSATSRKPEQVELTRVQSAGQGTSSSRERLVPSRQQSTVSQSAVEDLHKPLPKKPTVSAFSKFTYFYNAPKVTFIHNCLAYIVFLLLFSYLMLVSFSPDFNIIEIIIIVWVFTIFIEEIRQLLADTSSNFRLKFISYIGDQWNIMDIGTLFLFLSGMILRSLPYEITFEVSRIVLAIDLMAFYFRLIHIFSVSRQLGPKLVMIRRMMIDLGFFVIILIVFIMGFGVCCQVILYPNSTLDWNLIVGIMKKPYWQMYGELFLEEIEGQEDCTTDFALYSNGTLPRCPTYLGTQLMPMLLALYMLFTNVLMLNLLIAMFSYTFDKIHESNDAVWKFQRYSLVKEYFDRPPLAPPLIIFAHLFLLIRMCIRTSCGKCLSNDGGFRYSLSENEHKQLLLWENMNCDEYIREADAEDKDSMENIVKDANKGVLALNARFDGMTDSDTSGLVVSLPPHVEERLQYLEDHMRRTNLALDWIVDALHKNKMGGAKPDLPDLEKKREEEKKRLEEVATKEKEKVQTMMAKQHELHYNSRESPYPHSNVVRFNVTDDQVPWEVELPGYAPEKYTAPIVLEHPNWADIDLMSIAIADRAQIQFNKTVKNVVRTSFICKYKVIDGLPQNPKGRTGLIGRGLLGRWGPNFAGDPIVTRWKRDAQDRIVEINGRPVLEFVAIMRADNGQWALPGALLEPGQAVHSCIKASLTHDARARFTQSEQQMEIHDKLDTMLAEGVEIYKGYADDPRNTDNAWMETQAYNYHDKEGSILSNFCIMIGKKAILGDTDDDGDLDIVRAGNDATAATWTDVSANQPFYASHSHILRKVAELHNAFWI
ncbi:unnamed protein product [Owenia fusiformis]|uniref:Uncharacterized protein n=1 Tax=Owenia fusiformis TaxID=6347 RepID=A0A8S4MZY2_OWEFU|nr:unnamed protein product [Owenia fusiformis]